MPQTKQPPPSELDPKENLQPQTIETEDPPPIKPKQTPGMPRIITKPSNTPPKKTG